MFKSKIAFLLVALFSITSASYSERRENCEEYFGVKLKNVKINEKAFGKYESYLSGFLCEEKTIEGHKCAKDLIKMDIDGNLLLYKSAGDEKIKNLSVPMDTWIYIYDDRFVCVFPREMQVQGYKVLGGGGVKGTQAAFYNSGKLKYFFSKDDIIIGGVNCKGNKFMPTSLIGLYESGKLMSCTLAETQTINSKVYKKGTNLKFDGNGKIKDSKLKTRN